MLKMGYSPEDVRQVFGALDRDGDGKITQAEWESGVSQLETTVGPRTGSSYADMMRSVAPPRVERFKDLAPEGAGCAIIKTEERGITVGQLQALKGHIARRAGLEGWVDCRTGKRLEHAGIS